MGIYRADQRKSKDVFPPDKEPLPILLV